MVIGILPACKFVRASGVLKLAVKPGSCGRAANVLTAEPSLQPARNNSYRVT